MEQLLFILPALACPLGMGLMMWLMMRAGKGNGSRPTPDQQQELAELRAQIEAMRPFDERHPAPRPDGGARA